VYVDVNPRARFRDVRVLLADARISVGADDTKEDPP
jgi:hypothetical protein